MALCLRLRKFASKPNGKSTQPHMRRMKVDVNVYRRQKEVVAEEVHADENVALQAGRAATETTRRVESLLKKLTALKKVRAC